MLLANIYCFSAIFYQPREENGVEVYAIFSRAIILLIFLILLSYFNEKLNRRYFHQIFIQKNYLANFKTFIKEFIQEPIIV